VALETMGDGVSVSITDDGKGGAQEDESVPGSDHHASLVEMRERAELAGGWFRIESAPGGGTTIRFWVPAPGAGVGSELVGPEFD
jgi:signal transduction histidine kinase